MIEQVKDFLIENYFIVIAVGMMVMAVVILLVVAIRSRRHRNDPGPDGGFGDAPYMPSGPDLSGPVPPGPVPPPMPSADRQPPYADIPMPSSRLEKTIDESSWGFDDEKTVDEQSMFDNEKTVDGGSIRGTRVAFHISFCGRRDTIERQISDQLILGRGDKCDVDVVFGQRTEEAKQTSREHAVVINRPEGLFVRDKESHNGTSLNGMVLREEQPLRNGDVLQLGKAIVQISIDPGYM